MSQDRDDEWEIVEDEIISSYVNEEIVGTSEPKFYKIGERCYRKIDYWKSCWVY